MGVSPIEHLDQIVRNTQYTQELLLCLPRDTAEQAEAIERAMKNQAEWLKEDVHAIRKAFESEPTQKRS